MPRSGLRLVGWLAAIAGLSYVLGRYGMSHGADTASPGADRTGVSLSSNRGAFARTAAAAACAVVLVCACAAGGVRYAQQSRNEAIARALLHGDPASAPALIRRYGCGGCHTISAAPGADGQVGPSLNNLRQRVFIGGAVRNAPDNLVRWIVSPSSLAPGTAMPASGITEAEARDVATFLYAH